MLKRDYENPSMNDLSCQASTRYGLMSPKMIVSEVLAGKDDMEGMYYLLTDRYRGLLLKIIGKMFPNVSSSDSKDDLIHDFWFFLYGNEEPHWKKVRGISCLEAFGGWLSTTSYHYFLARAMKEKEKAKLVSFSEDEYANAYAEDPEEVEKDEEWEEMKVKMAAEVEVAIIQIKNPQEQFAIAAFTKEVRTETIMAALTAMRREADPTAKEVSRDYVYVLIGRAKEKIKNYINRENNLQL